MNIQQLRTICAIADNGLSLSQAAKAVNRSQSAVTRQLQDLEENLGIKIFNRSQSRILGITSSGETILERARKIVREAEAISSVAKDAENQSSGDFSLTTTHTQARYVLPNMIRDFILRYPAVNLTLREGNPAHCCALVASGRADIAIATSPAEDFPQLIAIPCYQVYRSIIAPRGHPLLEVPKPDLTEVAKYPLILYDEAFSARRIVSDAFARRGLKPRIVLSAIDADVSKRYVEMGLGLAIVANVAFDSTTDTKLRRIDARHLFGPSTLSLFSSRSSYLRRYVLAFAKLFAPHVDFSALGGGITAGKLRRSRTNLPAL